MKKNKAKGSAGNFYGVTGTEFELGDTSIEREARGISVHFQHSAHYHKYFRGYTEVRMEKGNGKYSIQRFYTHPWIVQDVEQRMYILWRILYVCLLFFSIYAFMFALTRAEVPSNRSWIVAIMGFPGTILLLILAAYLVQYLFAPKRMKLREYALSARLILTARLASGVIALTAVLTCVYTVLFSLEKLLPELCCAATLLLSAAAAFSLSVAESHMKYKEIPNHTKLPEQGERHEL